ESTVSRAPPRSARDGSECRALANGSRATRCQSAPRTRARPLPPSACCCSRPSTLHYSNICSMRRAYPHDAPTATRKRGDRTSQRGSFHDLQEAWWLESGVENDRQQEARWVPTEGWRAGRDE